MWTPSSFQFHTAIDYDIHDPYTDKYLKAMAASLAGPGGLGAAHPTGKEGNFIIV